MLFSPPSTSSRSKNSTSNTVSSQSHCPGEHGLTPFTAGPILRISPREVHISDVSFLDEIYASGSRRRDKDPAELKTLPVPLSTGGTGQHDLHRKRREALNPYFTRKSVVAFEPAIAGKVRQLDDILDRYCQRRQVLNLSDVLYGFATEFV